MSQAADPGLEAEGDTYQIASDFCAILATSLLATAQSPLPPALSPPPPIQVSDTLTWSSSCYADSTGALHRWLTVDAWDQDAIARELHAWHTVGDLALYDAPLTLHVVVIGQRRAGRQRSPWCQGWRAPVTGAIRFQRPDGKGGWRSLSGDQWTPVWLADLDMDAAAWLAILDADGVTPRLLLDPSIAPLAPAAARQVREHIAHEAGRMVALGAAHPGDAGGLAVPMSRPACDGIVPCPWQPACYTPQPLTTAPDIASLGLYAPRAADASGRSGLRPSSPLGITSV